MTSEMLSHLTAGELQQAAHAYKAIMDIYESLYDGPRGAMANREYFVARDNYRRAYAAYNNSI